MRKQYNLWQGDAWDVDRLVELSAGLPVNDVPLANIVDVDTPYWFEGRDEMPTVRDVILHARLINEVDLSHPIILAAGGRVMDGMHRVARALLEKRTVIKAVRFTVDPEPDYPNFVLAELPFPPETTAPGTTDKEIEP